MSVAPERLREFFAPRSLAVVGASDTSGWAQFILASSVAAGFSGPLIPVHPRHETVFGRPAVRSLRDLAEPVDLAFVMVPTDAVPEVIDDAVASGVRHAVVLASGYREAGPEGRAHQDRLVARAAGRDILLLGPNCLGFLNTHAPAGPFALNVPLPLRPGPVGIAMQSGALASAVLAFARSRAIGDVTGYVLANQRQTALTAVDHALDAAVADPGLDFVLFCGLTVPDARSPDEELARLLEERVRWLGERIASAPIRVIPMGTTCVDVSDYARDLMTGHGVHLLGGIDLGMQALGHALRWLEHHSTRTHPVPARTLSRAVRNAATSQTASSWSEAAARDLLAACAVPLVPAELVTSAEAAAQAARRLGSPVALKVCSAQIAHKSDIGGVALGVHGDAQVRDAYRRVLEINPLWVSGDQVEALDVLIVTKGN